VTLRPFTRSFVILFTRSLIGLLPVISHAQSAPEPPVHTYYDNKVVKERWSEDTNGQKHGVYTKYDQKGKIIAQYTYTHGVKNGSATYVDEYGAFNWHTPCKYVGVYKQGNKVGMWSLYFSVAGYPFSTTPDVLEQFDADGNLLRSMSLKGGKPVAAYSYDKQKQRSGHAEVYANGNENTFALGNYAADKPTGEWQNAMLSNDGSIEYRKGFKVTFSDGKAISTTDDHDKLTTVQELKRQQASAQLPAEKFYILTTQEDATFLKTSFTTEKGVVSGAELLLTEYLTTSAIAELIKRNPDKERVTLILKKAYVAQGNKTPIRLMMQDLHLGEFTTSPIMRLGEPRVSGEMVYYGLRGTGNEKGIAMYRETNRNGLNIVEQVIFDLSTWGEGKKHSIETWFNLCAQSSDLVAYRDTTKYPLRRWLYDQFKDKNAYMWMNALTDDSSTLKRNKMIPADAPDDEQLYPVVK
jgi:antitoxin component YwqK of YwqJK toxin-antitoxin module